MAEEANVDFSVGLVGLGEISCYFINAVENHPRSRMVAVCRRRPQEGDAEKYKKYTYYTDWKNLVDDARVNVVIIATPPSTHAEITAYALALNKRVISEKPFSIQLADAHNCIALANKHKTHLNFAYHAAMNPLTNVAKERVDALLAKGDKVIKVHAIYKEYVQNYHNGQSWIFNAAISGGGVLIDSGVNAISVVERLCGKLEPKVVKLGYSPDLAVETSAYVEFVGADSSNNQLVGTLTQDWLWKGDEQREISITFSSGTVLRFCFAQDFLSTQSSKEAEPVKEVDLVGKQAERDVHLTPMAAEYVNVVKFAFEEFDREEMVDALGVGPFEFVMKCYELVKAEKASL